MTALTDLLAEHQYRAGGLSSCTCGAPTPRFYRAHLATVIEAHYATELDRARAEALEEAASEVDAMEPFAHGQNATSKTFLLGWGTARKRVARTLRARAATYRTDRKD